MTSNLLKAAILLDAMAAIVPDFDIEGDAPKTVTKTFTVNCVYRPPGCCEARGTGEIRVFDDARHLEKYRGNSPSFVDALRDWRAEDGRQTWPEDACTSVDDDGDELITVFGSRNLRDVPPGSDRGTYAVMGGTGKFKGFSAFGDYVCTMTQSSGAGFAATYAMEVMRKDRRRDADGVASGPAYSPIAA